MSTYSFRHGQWVSFPAPAALHAGAHRTSKGEVVGIFSRGGKDAAGNTSPDHIAVVDPEGYNLVSSVGGIVLNVQVHPSQVSAAPLLDKRDIPERRREIPKSIELKP